MSKTCLRWLQIIEYFYEIYLLGCICMYIKNILETKSSTFMKKFSLRDQRKMWHQLEFKSASSNPRVQFYELQVQIHELHDQIFQLRIQIHELQVQIQELRVQTHESRVQKLEFKNYLIKTQVNSLNISSFLKVLNLDIFGNLRGSSYI